VIVPEHLLTRANALEAASFNVALIAGPALAGTISGLWDPAASLLAEAVLTLVALGLILLVPKMDRAAPWDATRSLLGIARDGLRQLVAVPELRGVTLTGALGLGGLGLLSVGFPFFCADVLTGDRNDAGYLWTAFAAGSALGAVGLVRVQDRFPPQYLVLGGLGLFGSLMFLWPLAETLPVAIALITFAALADGPGLAATFTVRQRWAPPDLHGQIFTTAVSMKVGAFSLGAAAAGPAVEALGARGTIVLAASVQLFAAAAGWLAMRAPARESAAVRAS
jgi:predicted MFS family arabinose efflux permease